MPTRPMSTVIKHLRRAALLQDGAGQPDGQLLGWFIRDRDEAAFEALVRRHGPMVMSVCRRLLRNQHDAEDAFQATFLVLACKAASIVPPEKVPNWLHGVAYHTALKAQALRAKRSGREKQLPVMPDKEEVQQKDIWQQLLPLLDRELGRLPDKYRLPIILCDLEGRPIKETARQLGWPQGTLAGRLARGRKMLAKRLTRHGLMLAGGVLAAVLSENAASAYAPAFLVRSTVEAASFHAAGQGAVTGLISVNVAVLTKGVVITMLLNKLKTATMVLVVLAMVAFGGSWAVTHATAQAQPGQAEEAEAKPPILGSFAPRPANPGDIEGAEFMFDTKVVGVEPDGHPRVMTEPRIIAFEDQVAIIRIGGTASEFPNIADACNDTKTGTCVAIKAKRVEAGKAQIDLTLSICKVEKAEKADTLIVANGVRAVREVEFGKPSKIVLSQDQQGKPQLWVELTAREAEPRHDAFPPLREPEPRHGAIPPPATATPMKANPEDPGASWPFID
jgi:RNA polymerase sigma factor (sigma-70 family)